MNCLTVLKIHLKIEFKTKFVNPGVEQTMTDSLTQDCIFSIDFYHNLF